LGIHFQAIERYEHDIVLEMFRYLLHTPTEESISLVGILLLSCEMRFSFCLLICKAKSWPCTSIKKLLSETTISEISYQMGENAPYAGVIEILVMKCSQWKSW